MQFSKCKVVRCKVTMSKVFSTKIRFFSILHYIYLYTSENYLNFAVSKEEVEKAAIKAKSCYP